MAQIPTVRASGELVKRVRAFTDELPEVEGRAPTISDAVRVLLERGLDGGTMTDPERVGYANGYARCVHEQRRKMAGVVEDGGAEEG